MVYDKRLGVVALPLVLIAGYSGKRFDLGARGVALTVAFIIPLPSVVGGIAVTHFINAHEDTDIFRVRRLWIAPYLMLTLSTNLVCSGPLALVHLSPRGCFKIIRPI